MAVPPLPSAPFDDLDLDVAEDADRWQSRLAALAASRLADDRARLEGLGIVDAEGRLVSRERPVDMHPRSSTSVETG